MRKLSLIILMILTVVFLAGKSRTDSPHGADFRISCDVCHSSKGWMLDPEVYSFDHNTTALPLVGQHQGAKCRSCHPTLVFSEAKTGCADCHTDMHYQTVGPDCERCHTPKSWLVEDITGLHQRSRFPLLGPHYTATCTDCHKDASLLRFQPLGVECIDCHQANYLGATSPNHVEAGYSTNCTECHLQDYNNTSNPNHTVSAIPTTCADCHTTAPGWKPATFPIHSNYYPLTGQHAVIANNCTQCHTNGYNNTPNTCVGCHQADYNNTNNPNHTASGFPTTCADCHTTAPGWKPAEFTIHDAQFFPIYSGKHLGTWTTCTECHANPSNYGTFTCIDCHDHNQLDMDDKHKDVGGYLYNSLACYECHPTGSTEGSFNHNNSSFPLTGAHLTTPCSDCHASGFAGTPTECSACHINKYNQTTDPNHSALGIPTTCGTCHTTNPGWKPATFPIHGNYYPLTGQHAVIANNCTQCHTNGYNNTPNTCVGCHQADYNNTNNPNHITLGISTGCATCHTTDPGWNPALFPQHGDYWVFQGAHLSIATQCDNCHNGNYNTTPNTCVGCHLSDYNSTSNPPHASAQFPTDCQMCHSQNVWVPSTFDHDGQYFPIYSGKHQGQWNLCSDCHANASNYADFTCTTACHPQSQTNNQHDGVSGYTYNSNACYSCHPNGNAPQIKNRKIFDNKNN